MTINYKIRDENLQYDTTSEAVKTLVLTSDKMVNMNILHVKNFSLLIKVEW